VLTNEHELAWEVVWRVLCSHVSRDFALHQLHERGPTDEGLNNVHQAALPLQDNLILALARARAEVLGYTVGRAQAAHQMFIKKSGGGGAGPGGSGTPRVPSTGGGDVHVPKTPNKANKLGKCVLCESTTHCYKTGAFEHTDKMTITKPCFKFIGPPGGPLTKEECGKLHAFSGPLKTPCRLHGAPMPDLGT
jgi:hypothetical protein